MQSVPRRPKPVKPYCVCASIINFNAEMLLNKSWKKRVGADGIKEKQWFSKTEQSLLS